MLNELSIKNIAIIDDLSVSFSDGLTVLSGETGAGKSIIINAVNLILGTRATSRLVRTGEDTAEIEALFSVKKDSPVAALMEKNGYDPSEGLLIRRVISQNDRHKIYINGRMGTGQILSEITENLASISGQHAHQGLLKEEQHLLLLDQFGNLMPLRESVYDTFNTVLPLIKTLEKNKRLAATQAEHLELLEFQKKEIEEAAIQPGEDETLEEQRRRLKHGEALYKTVRESLDSLYGMDGSIFENLSGIIKQMDKAVSIDSSLSDATSDLSDLCYKVEDVAGTLRAYSESIILDSTLLEDTEARIDVLNKLKRKYGGSGGTLADIEEHYESLCHELSDVQNRSDTIASIEEELSGHHEKLCSLSSSLSEKRIKAAKRLAAQIETGLASLEMNKTQFDVVVTQTEADKSVSCWLKHNDLAITETGVDRAVFMIAPNVGEEMKPLSRIASGGELSRVILAIKAILAEIDAVDTVIFDEVDAGIGGGTAEMVGKKIRELSDFHQVICITHLPQIAKFASHHYKIEKTVSGGRTSTTIKTLSENDRIDELARMLGGVEITQATLDHAREMLDSAV